MERSDDLTRAVCADLDASHLEAGHPDFHVWRSRGDTVTAGAWYGTRRADLTPAMEAAGLQATVAADTGEELGELLARQDQLAAKIGPPG